MTKEKEKIDEEHARRKELIILKHECNMKELVFIRETEKIRNDNMLSLHRLKRADRKRFASERSQFDYPN